LNFDFGYLVVLGAVVVILFVYRQLDKNNRSLDKIRKFAETVRHDLNAFVEERTATVRDFETVLKVHDKTATEILRRIQAVESNLLTRTPEIEQMQARLDRYAQSMTELEAQTGRIDSNLDRLKEETVFVDRVSQRIKASGEQMTSLEAEFVQIRQEFADINQKDLETVRKNALEVFERETLVYVQQLRDAQKQVDGFKAFVGELDLRRLAFVRETETALEAKADEVQNNADTAFREAARQAEDLSSVVFLKLEERIEKQAKDSESRLKDEIAVREAEVREGLLALQSRLHEIDQNVGTSQQETQVIQSRTQDELATLQETLKEAARRLRQDFQTEQAQLLTMTAQLKSDLEVKVSAVRQQVAADSDSLRNELQQSLTVDRQAAQTLVVEIHQLLQSARKEVQENEQKALDALEARLQDYEAGFAYRYGKMEEAEKDLAALDQNLRQAMERVSDRIKNDFAAFDEAMVNRRQEEQTLLEQKIETSQAAMVKLDKDLEDLKVRAYDNVSEKLQGFEEEFFEDLQKRNAAMTQSIEDWQKAQKTQLEELKATSERDRSEAERVMAEAVKTRVQELQTSAFQQMDKLERQVHEAQEATAASVQTYREEVEQTRARIVEELADLEKTLNARFEKDRARAELAAGESLTKLERDVEGRVRTLSDHLDQFKTDFQSGLDGAQTDFGLWQTKFDQRFKELEADLGEQYRAYKASLGEKIGALTDEFSLQKEELITRSAEDRSALRTDLAQIRATIEELETSLRARAQSAHDSFEREYESMSQDFQKKNRDLVADVENKLRDYRTSVNDTREKAEAMQKKLFGKIEDQASLLGVSLEEIEKRQKGFISQTKVFERADTLKQELQEAIEDLKGDLARIEVQRKDLFEIEASIARVKKLGDETSEKAAKFTSEKKRIDLMDSDFQRILGLSQSMELRLEQVTTSHDLLQDIQLRIRKLEDYSKDIEVRYERLEKRREVLDTTTDGVDRNFALLEKVEKAVRGLDSELKAMPGEVEDLRKRMKVLTQGKDAADKAVERLTQLDQTLKDVEGRIGRMEQAREWLAGVETRLVETKAAADEQVQTLATITKAAGGPTSKGRTPDNDLRQTVVKLARQGWGKEEISRATKLSLGEVELILELGSR
jgi:chromosome segregation ATPase